MPTRLPAIEDLLGEDGYRLEGIKDWDTISTLGKMNLSRLEALVEKFIYRSLAHDADMDELKTLARGKARLGELSARAHAMKPYLPRLRNELFRRDDELMLYLGDTPTATGEPWRHVRVIGVEKGHNAQWSMDSSARGFYWRVTVESEDGDPLLPGHRTLSFSTTEPRAILRSEWTFLRRARQEDPDFLDVFCTNARRSWTPIWCLELGLACDTDAMDMRAWLSP